jgi:hypothetical protein
LTRLLALIAATRCGYVMVPNALVAVILLVRRDVRGLYPAGLVAWYGLAARRALRFADDRAQ